MASRPALLAQKVFGIQALGGWVRGGIGIKGWERGRLLGRQTQECPSFVRSWMSLCLSIAAPDASKHLPAFAPPPLDCLQCYSPFAPPFLPSPQFLLPKPTAHKSRESTLFGW